MIGILTRKHTHTYTYWGTTLVTVVKRHGDGWVTVELPDDTTRLARPCELNTLTVPAQRQRS